MAKARAPLTPGCALGNLRPVEPLSLREASAALVAMLSGEQSIPPRGELRKIAAAVDRRRQKCSVSRLLEGGRHHG
jgi:hypothetical protein